MVDLVAEGARRQAAALDLEPFAVAILRADLYIVRALDDAELVRNAQSSPRRRSAPRPSPRWWG